MGFIATMIGPRRTILRVSRELDETREQVDRLEIELRRLTSRLSSQEGLLDALTHKVNGRLGGRPRTHDVQAPLPVGVLNFPPQEQR